MKILVTGSTGVIGQQLLKDLRCQYPKAEISGTYYQIRGSNSDYKLLKDDVNNIKYFHYSEIFKLKSKFDQIWKNHCLCLIKKLETKKILAVTSTIITK